MFKIFRNTLLTLRVFNKTKRFTYTTLKMEPGKEIKTIDY